MPIIDVHVTPRDTVITIHLNLTHVVDAVVVVFVVICVTQATMERCTRDDVYPRIRVSVYLKSLNIQVSTAGNYPFTI